MHGVVRLSSVNGNDCDTLHRVAGFTNCRLVCRADCTASERIYLVIVHLLQPVARPSVVSGAQGPGVLTICDGYFEWLRLIVICEYLAAYTS